VIFTDFTSLEETIYFALGMVAAITTAYVKIKSSGQTLYPVQKIEAGKAKIQGLTESNALLGSVAELISEVSADEIKAMIVKKKELDAMEGTTTEQKALVLGTMFLNAMKKE
jgi:hypothetical protein